MSDFIKNIASMFPSPSNIPEHFRKSGLDVFFPFYHAISNRPLKHMMHLYNLRAVEDFEKDLDYLLEYFYPLSMSEYLGGIYGRDESKFPMVLTFDDGLIQCYHDIMPILLRKGVPATFFLNNAFIDNLAMFFRFKVSLLIERSMYISDTQRKKGAELLNCEVSELRKRLLAVSYVEREITDQLADAWDLSFDDYLREEPVYLSSMHIRKMIDQGFEFGSHGIDHPMFSLLKTQTAIDHILASVTDVSKRYNLSYKYFAFPFTDSGVEDDMIEALFKKNIIDAGFGTAGLKDDKIKHYYQRVPMELLGKDARSTLKSEINRRRVRKFLGNNYVDRKA